jgi:competence protein ComEA
MDSAGGARDVVRAKNNEMGQRPVSGYKRCRGMGRAVVTLWLLSAVPPGFAQGPVPLPPGHPGSASRRAAVEAPAKRIDINLASRAELMTLPGIGNAEATKIIAGRPYVTKVDLVTRNVLAEGAYVALRDQIIAGQTGAPVSKK